MKKLNKEQIFLVAILILAIFSHFFRLGEPPTFMFDEVYHAFTAREMARGNKMAWEWWNTPPQGFAYEWTHPPLAKEAMVLGIKVFGENPFGWRFPVALSGVGVVYLVYLLGKRLFNEKVGLLAAFLINFDGLFFVQSRIGMNDTFFLFFTLLSFLLFLKQKWWGMGVALGLALASKWTAIYGILILGGLFLYQCIESLKQKPVKSLILPSIRQITKFLLFFLFVPLIIYLFFYLPFFTSGHTWKQFNELQHQMWWYHTRLKASHPYTSPWYSWPFMYRPVWYYVKYGENTIANIYAMGNPIIWWGGILTMGYLIMENGKWIVGNIKNRDKIQTITSSILHSPSSILLLGYFGFFLPWAFSPRIMFIYHYLPSVPFMCLALGYGLDKLWGNPKLRILATCYLILATLSFIYFYPHLSALAVPKWLSETYFWFPSWR